MVFGSIKFMRSHLAVMVIGLTFVENLRFYGCEYSIDKRLLLRVSSYCTL